MGDDGSSAKVGNEAADPLFLNHSDHPRLVLVSKKLNGDNYNTWSRSMRISLSTKNKIGFIDGSIKKPKADKHPLDSAAWQQCNDMVVSWLLTSLEPDVADSIIYLSTAHEIWDDLRERFSQNNVPRLFQINREIASLTQGQLSIAAYYTKLKGFWDELASFSEATSCTCGAQNETNRLMYFLMGLLESYSPIRGQILLMKPLPSAQAYSFISQEEKQCELGSTRTPNSQTAAMAVHTQSPRYDQKPVPHRHHNNNGNSSQHRTNSTGGSGYRAHASSAAHQVSAHAPTLQDIQSVMPHLSDSQYQQIMSVTAKTSSFSPSNLQAHAASARLGFEDDDWCGKLTNSMTLKPIKFSIVMTFSSWKTNSLSPTPTHPGLDLLNQPALDLPLPMDPTPLASIQAPLPADAPLPSPHLTQLSPPISPRVPSNPPHASRTSFAHK
ncbi:hypothetical protein L3X38_011111 [Prunus dulcis]|uniref:Retrotransposon Copia-like N-terminal domain-containing protein n=1 Tax=Prunus dulcis TaxID=3755 RepID=A0AAD4WGR4_PRUDU|nr:hypothetical protein L3X38_011111 [Prunus dulcis]